MLLLVVLQFDHLQHHLNEYTQKINFIYRVYRECWIISINIGVLRDVLYIFMKYKVLAGIDYSLRGPAICCHIGDTWKYENCIFHYLTGTKKYCDVFLSRYFGKNFDAYDTEEQRYDSISDWGTWNM